MTNSEFPRDPAKFKTWADDACRSWPEALTALAYNAHKAMQELRGYTNADIAAFDTAYSEFRAELA